MIKQLFIICISLFISIYLSIIIRVGSDAVKDTKQKSAYIIVLGAASHKSKNHINLCLKARVVHATNIFKEGFAPQIVFSGGVDKGEQQSEAETMLSIAQEQGIRSSNVLLEKKSTSTYENFMFSKSLLKNSRNTVIIVTDPYHSTRASLVAHKLGIPFTISAANDSPCWNKYKFISRFFLMEPLNIMWYRLSGKA